MKSHVFSLLFFFFLFSLKLNAQLDPALISALKNQSVEKIDSLIDAGLGLHATDENGANALMWACYLSNARMVAHLFENGAEPPEKGGIYDAQRNNRWYGDLLAVAAGMGKNGMVEYLLEVQNWSVDAQPVHPDIDSLSGWTALMHAAQSGNAITAKKLLDEGADLALKNQNGRQAFELTDDIVLREGLQNGDGDKLEKLAEQHDFSNKSISSFYQENFLQAIEFGEKALNLAEELYGKNATYYSCMGNLAAFNNYAGFFEKTVPLYNQTLEYYEKNLGKDHIYVGRQLSNLAKCYTDLGNYEKASAYYERAIAITRKNEPDNITSLVIRLNGLGYCYRVTRQFEKALSIHNEALEISKQTIDTDPADYAESLTHLASLYHDMGQLEKALQVSERSIDFSKKSYGEWHSNYGFRISKHAQILADMGKTEDALNLSLQSVAIADSVLGKKHRFYGDGNLTLANMHNRLQQYKEAAAAFEEVLQNIQGIINNHFPYVSEASKLTWRNRFAYRQDLLNSFYFQRGNIPSPVVNFNISLKGLTINNNSYFLEDQSGKNHKKWLELKRLIGAQLSKSKNRQNPSLESWVKEADRLESELASESKNFANQKKMVDIEQLRAQLETNEAIIDFLHFNYYDIDRKTDSVMYVACLIRPEKEKIELIRLFEENTLEALVDSAASQQALVGELYASRGAVTGNRKIREGLLSIIWGPILPYLADCKKIYLSPSGLLHKFNLAVIPISDDELIQDRFQVFQFNNLKSMLDDYEKPAVEEFLLVGGVEYDIDEGDSSGENSFTEKGRKEPGIAQLRSKTAEKWNYLEGTQKEVQAISKTLDDNNAQKKIFLNGSSATEDTIKSLLNRPASPNVLHFSTHGFFFPDIQSDNESTTAFKASDNPMIRSGLILAGANHYWQTGKLLPGQENDGILTAYEVANLHLGNTELVVLSACETGLGDIQGSEGVFGLQRAFKTAGARYILMSLWQVPDDATQKLMALFYKNWLSGMEIHEALKNAQEKLKQRKRYENPYFWAGFVLIE